MWNDRSTKGYPTNGVGNAAPGKAKHTPAVIPFLAQNLPADLTTGVMLVAVIPMIKCPSTARGIFVAGS